MGIEAKAQTERSTAEISTQRTFMGLPLVCFKHCDDSLLSTNRGGSAISVEFLDCGDKALFQSVLASMRKDIDP